MSKKNETSPKNVLQIKRLTIRAGIRSGADYAADDTTKNIHNSTCTCRCIM